MPKSTFFNLPESRQQELLEKAERVFLESSYDIPITELIKALGVPTGSFYRYFADKDDLFLHMFYTLSDGTPRRDDLVHNPRHGGGVDLLTERRRKRNKLMRSAPPDVLRKFFFGKNKERVRESYRKELQRLKYNGELRPDVDLELIAYMYATTLFNFEMYCREEGLAGDEELIWKMKQYFYYSFFKYGIFEQSDEATVIPE